MKSTGLKVVSGRGDTHLVPTQATDNPAEIGKVDIVLFCVKLGTSTPPARKSSR